MHYTTTAEIETLVQKFQNRSLPSSDWTHVAHITTAI